MEGKMIVVGSSTYAMKGKELLVASGISAYVERTKSTKEYGCGYGITVKKNANDAVRILRQSGIKILAVIDK